MGNLIAFLNSFLSYLLLFVICVAVVIIAIMIGINLRKRKDQKDALIARQEALEKAAKPEDKLPD